MRAAELNAIQSNNIFYDHCAKCGAWLEIPSVLPECEGCEEDNPDFEIEWYTCELWIVDKQGRQRHCWTPNFTSAEDCKAETLKHYQHAIHGRPRIYRVDADGNKTFVEEIDARTPEQIAYSKQTLPI